MVSDAAEARDRQADTGRLAKLKKGRAHTGQELPSGKAGRTLSGTHQRLVDKRIETWRGRISARAATTSLQAYELILAGYLLGFGGIVAFSVCVLVGADMVGYVLIAMAAVAAMTCFAVAVRYARVAGEDIARQYGLPARSWRRAKVKTPEQFDRWIATQPVRWG